MYITSYYIVHQLPGYYAKWANEEPSGENMELNCGALDINRNYLLNDKKCNTKYAFICMVPGLYIVFNNYIYIYIYIYKCVYVCVYLS